MAKKVTIICWCVSALALIFLAIWFASGTSFGIGGFGLELTTGSYKPAGTYTVSAEKLDSLHVDWVSDDVSITPYDGTEVMITEYARRELRENEKLQYAVSDATLRVNFCESGLFRNIPSKKLEILLPRTFSGDMTKLVMETTSGAINASGFTAETVTAESTSGKIQLSDFTAENLRCESTSGAIKLEGSLESGNIDTTSGSITVKSETLPHSLKTDSTSGSVSVTVPGDGEVTVNHSSTSGKFSSEIPVIMQNRDARFSFSTTSGHVNIYAYK